MNRTDRLLAIILELQSKNMQRAEDIAKTFETSVRTIYRDMQALSEAGVPIIGAPGQGYSLMDNYFLPPITFTADETVTLLLGIDFIEQQFDVSYRSKAISSRNKIEAVLTEDVRNEAERVRTIMKLATKHSDHNEWLLDGMALIRQAIVQEQQICFRYRKNKQGLSDPEETIRQTNPYGLVFTNGDWMLIAFCHLREEIRHFLLRRMSEIQLLEKTFNRPSEFNLHTYTPLDDRNVIVKVLVHPYLANKVKEYNYYYMDSIDKRQEGLYVTLRVRRPEDALQWVLSWGSGVVVLEPESLRKKIKEEAKKILKGY